MSREFQFNIQANICVQEYAHALTTLLCHIGAIPQIWLRLTEQTRLKPITKQSNMTQHIR
jgi:hypothetical protein